ncbi:MAG: hypothetical protein ACT4QG_08420 [Sporichthyaceae bacterium]
MRVAALLWGLPAGVVLVGYLVLPHENGNGRCEGLGFGCEIPPADLLVWAGLLAAGPLLLVGLLAMLGIALCRRVRGSRRGADRA